MRLEDKLVMVVENVGVAIHEKDPKLAQEFLDILKSLRKEIKNPHLLEVWTGTIDDRQKQINKLLKK